MAFERMRRTFWRKHHGGRGEEGEETGMWLLNSLPTAGTHEENPAMQKPDGLASRRRITNWEGAGS